MEGGHGGAPPIEEARHSPDEEWCADTLIKLTRGVTAYRLEIPESSNDAQADHVPLVVCLHDISNASYMWKDLAFLLQHVQTGPPARVLVLDFYGSGRSPWCEGVKCTLDTFVHQVKELIDVLGMSQEKYPFTIIGQGLGAAVAAGFTARYPTFVQSLALLNPAGIRFNETFLLKSTTRTPFIGKWQWHRSVSHSLEDSTNLLYATLHEAAPHHALVKKDLSMLKWQATYTPGFYGAMLSKFEHFPLGKDALYELYAALGSHPSRPMLIATSDNDDLFGGSERQYALQECFHSNSCQIVSFNALGHNLCAEGFKETATLVLRHVEEAARLIRHAQDGYEEDEE